jgi:hypothetical protein
MAPPKRILASSSAILKVVRKRSQLPEQTLDGAEVCSFRTTLRCLHNYPPNNEINEIINLLCSSENMFLI